MKFKLVNGDTETFILKALTSDTKTDVKTKTSTSTEYNLDAIAYKAEEGYKKASSALTSASFEFSSDGTLTITL